MKKPKLLFALIMIVLVSAFLSGCYAFDSLSDMFCCDTLFFPLPLAIIYLKYFR
jgi:hypothetical protein